MSTKAKSTTKTSRKRVRRRHTALEKCQAVLAIWTERRSTSEIGKQMGVSWSQLRTWQDQALEGMLRALEPRQKAADRPAALTPKLQKLLASKGLTEAAAQTVTPALQKRLSEIQKAQPAPASSS